MRPSQGRRTERVCTENAQREKDEGDETKMDGKNVYDNRK
jgi:hypothetical protein